MVMIAVITAPDSGKKLVLSPKRGADQKAAHLPWFQQLTVKETISGFSEISVSVTPPTYQEALEFLESPWLLIGNTISVKFGYSSHQAHISPWHHGFMLQPDISFGDDFAITIKAQSFGWHPSRMQTRAVWSTSDKLAKKGGISNTPLMIIYKISQRYNFELNWNDNQPFSFETEDALNETGLAIQQGGLNDWMFLKMLCAKAGCRFFITKGNVMNVMDAGQARDPKTTLEYRGQMDLLNNVFPIWSFDSETQALFLPRRQFDAKYFGPDSKKGTRVKTTTADATTTTTNNISGQNAAARAKKGPSIRSPDGKKTLPTPNEAAVDAGGGMVVPVFRRRSFRKQFKINLDNSYKWNAENHGVEAKASGPSVPSLLPEDLVKVRGVGKYYSVNYRVHEVIHTYGESFAQMDIDLKPKGFNKGAIAKYLRVKAKKSVRKDPPKGPPGKTRIASRGAT
jgi:hypothetical protein